MEIIQVKTVDPISQDLLKSAYQKGIKLPWDRFEKLQPQDGFLRMGLSCPYGCLQGPCRIDPFGRGPERGLCGLDRDGMVAAFLLRLSLSGALEAMTAPAKEISWDPALKDAVSRVSKKRKVSWKKRTTSGEADKPAAGKPKARPASFLAAPTPMIEPINVCELDAGRPRYQVPRFHMIAAISRAGSPFSMPRPYTVKNLLSAMPFGVTTLT